MFVLLASLVALKHTAIGETLFEKHYMPLVLAAVMPVVTAVQLTVNGGGNISVEQLGSVAVQPATTQQSLISSAKNA
ncbi:hypothetical protein QL285_041746 [Trifolium repens]|nr:hypothetical protein QL285_041746 [Trifolium repens]